MGARRRAWAVSIAAVVALSGCGTPLEGGRPQAPIGIESIDPTAIAPETLVGLWRVRDAEGEAPETWLRLAGGSYQLWRDCGFVEGAWSASSDRLFVASTPFAAVSDCGGGIPSVPWLEAVREVAPIDDGGWELRGAAGEPVATLVVDGAPEPIANAADFYAAPPEVDGQVRDRLRDPAPVPDGLTPATRDQLPGRWVPVGAMHTDAHVDLADDGTYTGSDGCNGASGAWAAGDGGRFLATSGLSTMIGCDGAQVPGWLGTAGRAAFDGELLVLLDADGAELGRLVRD